MSTQLTTPDDDGAETDSTDHASFCEAHSCWREGRPREIVGDGRAPVILCDDHAEDYLGVKLR